MGNLMNKLLDVREELIERDRTTTISPNSVTASVSPIVLNILPFELPAST